MSKVGLSVLGLLCLNWAVANISNTATALGAGREYESGRCQTTLTCADCVYSYYVIINPETNVGLEFCTTSGGGTTPEGQNPFQMCTPDSSNSFICQTNTNGGNVTCQDMNQYWCLDENGETTPFCKDCNCDAMHPPIGGGVNMGPSGCVEG